MDYRSKSQMKIDRDHAVMFSTNVWNATPDETKKAIVNSVRKTIDLVDHKASDFEIDVMKLSPEKSAFLNARSLLIESAALKVDKARESLNQIKALTFERFNDQ